MCIENRALVARGISIQNDYDTEALVQIKLSTQQAPVCQTSEYHSECINRPIESTYLISDHRRYFTHFARHS